MDKYFVHTTKNGLETINNRKIFTNVEYHIYFIYLLEHSITKKALQVFKYRYSIKLKRKNQSKDLLLFQFELFNVSDNN